MSSKHTTQVKLKYILWALAMILIIISIIDFGTWAEGINTYAMYFLIGMIMLYVLLKFNRNKSMIWSLILISGIYFVVECFNMFYYSFFPATAFFTAYCSVFSISLVTSLIIVRKDSIKFDYKASKTYLIIVFTVIAIVIGYGIQWVS